MAKRFQKMERIIVNDYSNLTNKERSFVEEIELLRAFNDTISKRKLKRYNHLMKLVKKKYEYVPTIQYMEDEPF